MILTTSPKSPGARARRSLMGLGWLGLGQAAGEYDPATGVLQAGCIGCAEGDASSPASGGGGAGSGGGVSPETEAAMEAIGAGCDQTLTSQGYTCAWDVENGYRYTPPTGGTPRTAAEIQTMTGPTTPGSTGSGQPGPGSQPASGQGSGTGQDPTKTGGNHPFKPSTLVWVLLGSIAFLSVGNVAAHRRRP